MADLKRKQQEQRRRQEQLREQQREQHKLHQEQTRRQEQLREQEQEQRKQQEQAEEQHKQQREQHTLQMQQVTENTTSMNPPSHTGLQPLSHMGQHSPSTGLVVRGSSEVVGFGHGGCLAHALVKTTNSQ
jgi:hypothetical protein